MSALFFAMLACTSTPMMIEPGPELTWPGPEASLDTFCSDGCEVIERREFDGIELVVFAHGSADAELAVHTDAGWFNPTGTGFRAERGRHSPGGIRYDLSSATLADGIITLTTHAHGSGFAPGGPSTSHRTAAELVIDTRKGVSAHSSPVFSENCTIVRGSTPVCSTIGTPPK